MLIKHGIKFMSRMNESGDMTRKAPSGIILMRSTFMRIAAAALILIKPWYCCCFISAEPDALSKKIVVATDDDQKNLKVTLPDGSNIYPEPEHGIELSVPILGNIAGMSLFQVKLFLKLPAMPQNHSPLMQEKQV